MATATYAFNPSNQLVITWTSATFGTDYGAVVVPGAPNAVEGTTVANFSGAADGTDGGVGVALQHNAGDGEGNQAFLFAVAQRKTATTVDLVYGYEGVVGNLDDVAVADISSVTVGLRSDGKVFLNGTQVASFDPTGSVSTADGLFGVAFSGDPANVLVLDSDWTDTAGALIDDGTYVLPDGQPIKYMDWDEYRWRKEMDRSSTTDFPIYWTWKSTTNGTVVALWPTPDNDCLEYRFEMHVPQGPLETDGTDDNTTILMPWRPLWLGALYLALNERGEEIGEPGNIADTRYRDALLDAIEQNNDNQTDLGNLDMRRP